MNRKYRILTKFKELLAKYMLRKNIGIQYPVNIGLSIGETHIGQIRMLSKFYFVTTLSTILFSWFAFAKYITSSKIMLVSFNLLLSILTQALRHRRRNMHLSATGWLHHHHDWRIYKNILSRMKENGIENIYPVNAISFHK
jgi:hypothetical protein